MRLNNTEAELLLAIITGNTDELKQGERTEQAGRFLLNAGFTRESHVLRCYVLTGYRGDTIEKAEARMKQTYEAGFMPMAMLFRDKQGDYSKNWKQFQRQWANPIITACNCKN